MKILGIFRGFPGLGRVVSGVSLLETLRDEYGCAIKIISYLQGNRYLQKRRYTNLQEVVPMDYCSIGLLPTNKMGGYIHNTIKNFSPDVVVVDGEPLIIQSLRISYPNIKIVALLNPADVDNSQNDKEAMDYFNALYSLSDLAVVHGLRTITKADYAYKKLISINTILRKEVMQLKHKKSMNIYCILGGGTVNVSHQFAASTIRIAELCQQAALQMKRYTMHIVCSSQNIYDAINENYSSPNIILHNSILNADEYYSNAGLIITRSGRNTLSELAYLGIPAVSIVTGDKYRCAEQQQNLCCLQTNHIRSISIDSNADTLVVLMKELLNTPSLAASKFNAGNYEAIKYILSV